MALDLAANVDEPAQERSLGYRTGRREILEELTRLRLRPTSGTGDYETLAV